VSSAIVGAFSSGTRGWKRISYGESLGFELPTGRGRWVGRTTFARSFLVQFVMTSSVSKLDVHLACVGTEFAGRPSHGHFVKRRPSHENLAWMKRIRRRREMYFDSRPRRLLLNMKLFLGHFVASRIGATCGKKRGEWGWATRQTLDQKRMKAHP